LCGPLVPISMTMSKITQELDLASISKERFSNSSVDSLMRVKSTTTILTSTKNNSIPGLNSSKSSNMLKACHTLVFWYLPQILLNTNMFYRSYYMERRTVWLVDKQESVSQLLLVSLCQHYQPKNTHTQHLTSQHRHQPKIF
jgi:hypothetical protein